MELDRATKFVNRLLLGYRQYQLSGVELLAFRAIWSNLPYDVAAQSASYETATVRNAASKLLKDLSAIVNEPVSKKSCRNIIVKVAHASDGYIDLADAPTDIQPFCGRSTELETLMTWLTIDRCKLVGILGIGGIGKTALAARLIDRDLSAHFDLVIWRSLREAPPLEQLLGELVPFLSGFTEIDVPTSSDRAIARLLDYLGHKRCAILLDNVEAIMEVGADARQYRSGYADYGQLFQMIGTAEHQSCVVLTSREPPPDLAQLAGTGLPVRSFYLSGLAAEAPVLLAEVGLRGKESELLAVAECCQGNPLYLRIVANTILHSFNSQIDSFLAADRYTYGKIIRVLQDQLKRLSTVEKLVVYHLAIGRESLPLANLARHFQPLGYSSRLLPAIDSLQQRSLIEVTQSQNYTLQNVVMEFVTAALTEELTTEIAQDRELFFFNSLALYPASSPTYVREIQRRLILQPLVIELGLGEDRNETIDYCNQLRRSWAGVRLAPGYAIGNIINILMFLGCDLQGQDFSRCYIAEVDFQTAQLQGVNFSYSNFDRCRFAQSLGSAIHLAFSSDGKYLAAADTSYQIKIWEVATNQEIALLLGHQSWVWQTQFSHDRKYLISGSSDRTMRIWSVASGECLQVIEAHQDWVWKVSFGLNSQLAISIGADRYIKVWWWQTGRNLLSFKVPDLQVRDGAFHPQRGLLAICSGEGIKVWQVWLGRCILKLTTANAFNLRLVSFSPDGKILVGTSFECEIHCWEVDSGKHLFRLTGHPTQAFEVNYDEGGRLVSTCLEQVRVWNLNTGHCVNTINLARDCGKGVAYRAPLIATGSDNGTVKVWHLETGQCLQTAAGKATRVMAVATHPHDRTIATTQDDGTIKLWDLSRLPERGQIPPVRAYRGHQGMATVLAFSDDGTRLATTGSDRIIKVWDVSTGRVLQSLTGHTDYAIQLLFLDDRTILSRSYDASIRQWDLRTGLGKMITCIQPQWCMTFARSRDGRYILFGSDIPLLTVVDRQTDRLESFPADGNRLRTIAYTADERYIVAISDDRHLNLWDLQNHYAHRSWRVGDREITGCFPHPHDPHLCFLAAEDGYILVWDLFTQTCRHRILAHDREIRPFSMLHNPDYLVSAGIDGKIKLWEFSGDSIVEVYAIEFAQPYRDLNIAGATGLNPSQLLTLSRLGAIAENGQRVS
jgi:WD40 repeat protein